MRFFNIAQASLEEARYYLILACDLGYAHPDTLLIAAQEIGRMLTAYSHTLARGNRPTTSPPASIS